MRSFRLTRPAALLSALAAGAAATTIGILPATAAGDPVTLEGAAARSGGTVLFTYTLTVSGQPITAASFTTDQDQDLPVDDQSVGGLLLDRTLKRPTSRTDGGTGKDLTVDLGTLEPGTHTVSFPVRLPTSGPAKTTMNSASVTTGGPTYASAAVPVAINSPDLALAYDDPDSSEVMRYAGLGYEDSETYDVTNIGTAAAAAVLRLQLPAGIELGEDGVAFDKDEEPGAPISCTPDAGDLVCPLGTVTPGAAPLVIDVDLVVTAAGAYGTRGTYAATVEPAAGQPADADTKNNSLSYEALFTGVARLTIGASAATPTLVVGHRTSVTLNFANAGPNPALFGTAILFAGSTDDPDQTAPPIVRVTSFDGRTEPPAGYPQAARTHANQMLAHVAGQGVRPHADDPEEGSFFTPWFVGDLRAGTAASAHLTLQGLRPGRYTVAVLGFSAAGNPSCDLDLFADEPDPCFGAVETIRVVAAPARRPSGNGNGNPIGGGTNGTGATLPNTGSPTVPLTLTGLALLLAGAGLTRMGRRRITA